MPTKIGRQRDRVAIKRLTQSQRSDGGYDTSLSTVTTVWADIEAKTGNSGAAGKENEQAGRLRGNVRYIVQVHRETDVTPDDYLTWVTNGDLPLNIKEVQQVTPRSLYKILVCEEGAVISA